MRPEGWVAFGGGGDTSLHPTAMAVLVIGLLLLWLAPRRHMLGPFFALALLIPLQQQVVILGLHFTVLRIVLLCACLRVAPRFWQPGKFLPSGMTATDVVLPLWLTWAAIAYSIAWDDLGALVPKLGALYNATGTYFLLRHLVRDRPAVERTVRMLALICTGVAALMAIEQMTGRNLLSFLGAPAFAEVRQGRIRAQASFAHPILAGTFGALLFPVFLGLWWSRPSRLYAAFGVSSAAVIILASSSSTPVGAVIAGVAAILAWPLRRYMRPIRWAALASIIMLHLVMKAPVWSLLHRVRFVGGSTSWDRFMLVDQCIRRFGEWWLVGTTNNAAWGFDMWDISDWYVAAAVTGGLLGLALFISLIALSFRNVGRALRFTTITRSDQRLVWGIGAGLFASTFAFLGVSLFDQTVVVWYALHAFIVTMTYCSPDAVAVPRRSRSASADALVPVAGA